MAQLVIAAAGSAIGGAVLGTGVVALGLTGNAIGWAAGSIIGSFFAPTQKSEGPRLNDLVVTGSAYGSPIPYCLGTPRVAGQIIWASNKREIATTTEQGKGGGGSEFTSYTYEVDMLVLLTDNVVPGIDRVWSNGELVWNKSPSADPATILASDAAPQWRRITFYDGDSSQLPDPTYEAAVGAADALAYRGRGTVFLEGLQLGGGGQIPNVTYEIGPEIGDHEPGDGLTRLQTAFFEADSSDISSYAIGPGSIAGVVNVSPDQMEATIVGSTVSALSWDNADLGRVANTGHTFEYFFRAVEVTVNPTASTQGFVSIDNIDNLDDGGVDGGRHLLGYNGYSGGINQMVAAMTSQYLWSSGVDVFKTGFTHVAYVYDDSAAGDLNIYVDGVRVVTIAGAGHRLTGVTNLRLGGATFPGNTCKVQITGVRVRRAAMYSGASFSAPSGPHVWGAP